MRIATFEPAGREVVHERVHAGGGDVGVRLEVERGVEQRMRIAAFERRRWRGSRTERRLHAVRARRRCGHVRLVR